MEADEYPHIALLRRQQQQKVGRQISQMMGFFFSPHMKRPDGEKKEPLQPDNPVIDFFFFFFLPQKNLEKWNFQNGNEKERCRSSDARVLHSFPRSSLALGRQR